MLREFISPPPATPGDLVRVVAPAGPFDRARFFRGLGWLAEHFRIRFDPGSRRRRGYLAGDDSRRLQELNEALRCPDTKVVVAARGGFGCTRIACRADFAALKRYPKWIVGFSDVTALHAEVLRHGFRSLHAANVTGLGIGDAEGRNAWLSAVSGGRMGAEATSYRLAPIRPGVATGPVIGGNLTLLQNCIAQARLQVPAGALLFLEEVGEAPYRIDRMLTSLVNGGVFDRISGLLLGQFTSCAGPDGHPTAVQLLRKLADDYRLPCAAGIPSGHEPRNRPLQLGQCLSLNCTGSSATLQRP